MRRFDLGFVGLGWGAAACLVSVPALADLTRAECVAANATGQTLRREGRFKEARAQLRVCNDPSCPAVVGEDCTRRIDELESAQPTIVFDAKDGSEHDLLHVGVTVDGQPFAEQLDGTPLEVDRGEHVFAFTVAGEAPVTERLVIKESERARRYRVVIGHPEPLRARESFVEAPRARPQGTRAPEKARWLPFVLAGTGVGGLVAGSGFGLMAANGIKHQSADCPSAAVCPSPSLAAADHASWTRDAAISTTAFATGGALVLAGTVMYFTGRSARPSPSALGISPAVSSRGGALLLRAEF